MGGGLIMSWGISEKDSRELNTKRLSPGFGGRDQEPPSSEVIILAEPENRKIKPVRDPDFAESIEPS
jgi:hypothetical protein